MTEIFLAPVGTQAERKSGHIWPGMWFDATGYLSHYSLGYHTGADLNLNSPSWDADALDPVYAIGKGKVTYARLFSPTVWGKIVVIDHGKVDGCPLFSRYAHLDTILVQEGDSVDHTSQIGTVANAEGLFPFHLHFDISKTTVLKTTPGHWPGENKSMVVYHYTNPQSWLQSHFGAGYPPIPSGWRYYYIVASLGLRVREDPSMRARTMGVLPYGMRIQLEEGNCCEEDGYLWGHLVGNIYYDAWIAMASVCDNVDYVSLSAPA